LILEEANCFLCDYKTDELITYQILISSACNYIGSLL